MRIRLKELYWAHAFGLWLIDDLNDGRIAIAKPFPLEWEIKKDGDFIEPQPTIQLSARHAQQFLQSLCDSLGELGYRPSNDRVVGELDASKKHLDREKQIVDRTFRLLEKLTDPNANP